MNKNLKGIIALVITVALAFCVIWGTNALTKGSNDNNGENEDQFALEEIPADGYENVNSAVKLISGDGTTAGYQVTVMAKGYGGDVTLLVSFDAERSTVTDVKVVEQAETEGLGSKITEEEFLKQFSGAAAPVYLPGMENASGNGFAEAVSFKDGTYEARTEGPDYNGYVNTMSMTVEDGIITNLVWDAVDEQGNKKSVMSENGEYVMTEDGPTWKAQAEALAAAVIENQSLSFLTTDEQGKTDAVAGVSISVNDFISLTEDCMRQAAGGEGEGEAPEKTGESAEAVAEGTKIDAISGATISSKAVVNGVNTAFDFLKQIK